MKRRAAVPRLGALAAVLIAGLLIAPAAVARIHRPAVDYNHDAVIFVHGFDGSGAQFESQQLRLTSNGYPQNYIGVFEYNSALYASALTNGSSTVLQEQVLFAQLDQLVAHMKAITHRPKVDLLAHSLGTKLMQDYLNSSPARAANVAHYVNIDGQTASSPPGGVPTLALWATRGPLSPAGRSITGAQNVSISDSTHVQCATSPLSFYYFYKFFNGAAPKTTQIVAQAGTITISGRAVNFPQNSGLSGATVQVWPINQRTGERTSGKPIATSVVGSSGDWGAVRVHAGRRYELTLVRTDNPTAPSHHFYFEPFLRSDHLVRLLESDALRLAGGAPEARAVALLIVRYKELWGDQAAQSDVLTINGQSVCNPTTCPLSKEVNGLFASDFNHDGKSETSSTWPTYENLGYFISSADVFAPAASPPTGEVKVSLRDRGSGPVRTISFPNFASTTDVVTAQFDDFTPPRAASQRSRRATRHRRTSRSPRAGSRHRRPRPSFTG
jgi:pimeloyl-ACP methyl ester carboxylesterase